MMIKIKEIEINIKWWQAGLIIIAVVLVFTISNEALVKLLEKALDK